MTKYVNYIELLFVANITFKAKKSGYQVNYLITASITLVMTIKAHQQLVLVGNAQA